MEVETYLTGCLRSKGGGAELGVGVGKQSDEDIPLRMSSPQSLDL